MQILKKQISGNFEMNLEVLDKGDANKLRVFFSADENLSNFVFADITNDSLKIGRKTGDIINIWKKYDNIQGPPWNVKILKKGNFFRFWVNGVTGWIRGPSGEWEDRYEPMTANIGLETSKNAEIKSFKVTELPWLSQANKPVIDVGPKGSFYEEQIIPGAILELEGTYYMYVMAGMIGNEEGSSRRTIGVATSKDLENWTMHPKPLISYKDYPYDNLYVNGAVVTPEGKIALMFSAQVFPEWKGFMLVTADNPYGPFVPYSKNPAYKHFTHAHEFDLLRVDHPDYRYMLFYSGYTPEPKTGSSGDRGYLLYSDDLKKWREHPTNPVFSPQTLDDWDAVHVRPRSLTKIEDTWYLWYEGCNNWKPSKDSKHHGWWDTVGLARSKDLVNWEHYPRNPTLPGLGISSKQFDSNWVGWPRMVVKGDMAYVFYTGNARVGLRKIPVKQLINWDTEGGETIDMLAAN
jgi:predicted GH43/DUF377 family glycosyl hydrolase